MRYDIKIYLFLKDLFMNVCVVCKSLELKFFINCGDLVYWECTTCDAKILDPQNRLLSNNEKKHYLKHNNSINDINYNNFLLKLINPLKNKISTFDLGLDYGCGFAPALANILKNCGFKVELYDPFFFPNKNVFLRKYKFITCSEVVEHFFNPYEEFNKINNILDYNSWFGVMTSFLLNDNLFEDWYYRRDPTHVVFYKKKTFQHIGFQRNWEVFFPADNVVLFFKK